MLYAVSFSARADKQLRNLEAYLSKRFSPDNAKAYVQRIVETCHSLSVHPRRGTIRTDLRPGVRVIGFEQTATIYYKVVDDQVTVLSVLYRGRVRGQPSHFH